MDIGLYMGCELSMGPVLPGCTTRWCIQRLCDNLGHHIIIIIILIFAAFYLLCTFRIVFLFFLVLVFGKCVFVELFVETVWATVRDIF